MSDFTYTLEADGRYRVTLDGVTELVRFTTNDPAMLLRIAASQERKGAAKNLRRAKVARMLAAALGTVPESAPVTVPTPKAKTPAKPVKRPLSPAQRAALAKGQAALAAKRAAAKAPAKPAEPTVDAETAALDRMMADFTAIAKRHNVQPKPAVVSAGKRGEDRAAAAKARRITARMGDGHVAGKPGTGTAIKR